MGILINIYLYATMLLCMLNASIHTKFSHFEILRPSNIRVRVKRDSASGQVVFKSLKFFALGNQFNITLNPGSPVIDPVDFEVKMMEASGEVTYHKLRKGAFYEGSLMGQRSSFVDASYIGGVWSAHIQTSHDSFFIEPLHKHDESGARHDMVIYRQTALKLGNNTSFESLVPKTFCGIFSVNSTANAGRKDSWSRHSEAIDKMSLNPNVFSPMYQEPRETRSTGEPFVEDLPKTGSKRTEHFPEATISRGINAHETLRLRRRFTNDIYYNTCDMLAIMDTVTFLTVGQGSVHKSASMLVYWYQLADRIFKRAKFGVFSGMRLKLKTILIMKEYTPSRRPHFNADPAVTQMYADDVLASLTNNSWFNDYCLVHLTTARHFKSSILGLATIANVPKFDPKDYRYKDPFWKSGICSANAQNAAFSCLKMENIILTDPMYLVIFVHEIAHGWGAEHDEYDNDCAPAEQHGGKYIMWYNHNGAKSPNSFTFSGCSGAQIQDVLLYKAYKCLLPYGALRSVCGNSILEYPEECDEGLLENSSCCTSNCRLHDVAVCSAFNHPCCTEHCTISPSTQQCFQATNMSCSQESHCDGLSYNICPQPSPLPNGSPCEDKGSCWHGVCLNYCENKGRSSNPARALVPCTCDTDRQAMCARCCAVPGTNSCLPEPDVFDDGMPCLLGFCKGGVCVGTVGEQLGTMEERLGTVKEQRLKLTGDSLQKAGFIRYLVFIVLILATPPFIFYTLCVCLLGRYRKCQSEDVQENEAVEVVVVSERTAVKSALSEKLSHTLNMPSTEVGELKNLMKFKPSSTEV